MCTMVPVQNEVLRAKTGHPSKCLPATTHAMEKMILDRQSKTSIMRTPPKHFLISLRTQPTAVSQAPPIQFSCYYPSTCFRNHCLTKIVISEAVRTFTSFLDFTYRMGWRAISQCRVCNILRQKQHYAGQKVLGFLILIFYSVIAELTRVVKGVVIMSEIKGKESGQPVYACALNARTLD